MTLSASASISSPESGVRSPEVGQVALWLGRMTWRDALERQRAVHAARVAGNCGDTLLLVEHPPTYTTGSGFKAEHLLATPQDLDGAEVVAADRGGSITYHGPGQLVGYPILDLAARGRDLHRYLRDLEEVLIRVLRRWGVDGRREAGKTGVFAGGGKIASIGVRVSKWVSMHGFALNISTDVKAFARIVPCGLTGCVTTSVHGLSAERPTLGHARSAVVEAFAEVCGLRFREES